MLLLLLLLLPLECSVSLVKPMPQREQRKPTSRLKANDIVVSPAELTASWGRFGFRGGNVLPFHCRYGLNEDLDGYLNV